nr:hypothetical protein [Tanacetum cinerariifolium]
MGYWGLIGLVGGYSMSKASDSFPETFDCSVMPCSVQIFPEAELRSCVFGKPCVIVFDAMSLGIRPCEPKVHRTFEGYKRWEESLYEGAQMEPRSYFQQRCYLAILLRIDLLFQNFHLQAKEQNSKSLCLVIVWMGYWGSIGLVGGYSMSKASDSFHETFDCSVMPCSIQSFPEAELRSCAFGKPCVIAFDAMSLGIRTCEPKVHRMFEGYKRWEESLYEGAQMEPRSYFQQRCYLAILLRARYCSNIRVSILITPVSSDSGSDFDDSDS